VYAIIEAGGKQHRVTVGDVFEVDRMKAPVGSTVELDRVLMVDDGGTLTTGHPTVPDARVVSTVLNQTRGPKIIVFRYKAKKRERKRTGHRQDLSRLRVVDIVVGGASSADRGISTITHAAPVAGEESITPGASL